MSEDAVTQQQTLLERDPSVRRAFDYYPTPGWMTLALWHRMPVWLGTSFYYVLEPCAGQRAIADVLQPQKHVMHVETNDLDPSTPCDTHLDAARPEYWADIRTRTHNRPDWGVTNVPFDVANHIVPLAVQSLSLFATILRLSWLEPTESRAAFLKEHPPNHLIVMPRHDFKGRGATDSVTSAWFVWRRGDRHQQIDIVTKDERDELIATYGKAA